MFGIYALGNSNYAGGGCGFDLCVITDTWVWVTTNPAIPKQFIRTLE